MASFFAHVVDRALRHHGKQRDAKAERARAWVNGGRASCAVDRVPRVDQLKYAAVLAFRTAQLATKNSAP